MKSKKELIKDCLALARKNIPPASKHLEISLDKGGSLLFYIKQIKKL